MTDELKRHKSYVWGLPEFNDEFHPHKAYHTDYAVISILQDLRDLLFDIRANQSKVAARKWWQFWR